MDERCTRSGALLVGDDGWDDRRGRDRRGSRVPRPWVRAGRRDPTGCQVSRVRRWIAAATVPCLLLTGCSGNSAGSSDGKLNVVTTTEILADLVQQVGGDRVTASSLVPAGGDPHSYEPTPADAKRVAKADVTFTNHLLLEPQSLIKTIDANAAEDASNVSLAEAYSVRRPLVRQRQRAAGHAVDRDQHSRPRELGLRGGGHLHRRLRSHRHHSRRHRGHHRPEDLHLHRAAVTTGTEVQDVVPETDARGVSVSAGTPSFGPQLAGRLHGRSQADVRRS